MGTSRCSTGNRQGIEELLFEFLQAVVPRATRVRSVPGASEVFHAPEDWLRVRIPSYPRIVHSSLEIVEGPVSPDGEHMSLSYGSFDAPGRDEPPFPEVAHVSPPREGVITSSCSMTRQQAPSR